MKPELQDKLVDVIGGIQAAVAKTTDFAVAQLPDIAQQYILFGRVGETLYLVIWIALTYACWRGVKKGYPGAKDDEGPMILLTGLSGVGGSVFLTASLFSLKGFVMAWFAPKIYLLQGLAGLVK